MKKMITIFLAIHMGFTFAQDFDIEGDLKLDGDLIFEQGNLVFEDETTMSTVPPGSPVGSIMLFAGTDEPDGWLLCVGQEVSRTEYSELFDVLLITYGGGDGVTTFNLPDLSGRVVVGKSTPEIFDTLGDTGGVYAPTNLAHSHSHDHGSQDLDFSTESSGDHYHPYIGVSSYTTETGEASGEEVPSYATNQNTSNAGEHTHPIDISNITSESSSSGDQDYGNMPPYIVLNYIIKH